MDHQRSEPLPSTVVTFPSGGVSGSGTVQLAVPLEGGRTGVVVDTTPFHPVDHTWPDQPADTGSLAGFAVVGAVTGATSPDGGLLVGEAVPVRRGEAGWGWHVVHVVDLGGALPPEPGDVVPLEVDVARRTALSAGHTACHLAALALNAEAAPLWRKEVDRTDSLGRPDFDALAIAVSRVEEGGAFDAYRLGKSLRKKGFDTAGLAEGLVALQAAVDARLAGWVATGAAVRMETDGDPTLTARRRWTCDLPDGAASLPCGGTHVASLAALGRVQVQYALADDGAALEVRTTVG